MICLFIYSSRDFVRFTDRKMCMASVTLYSYIERDDWRKLINSEGNHFLVNSTVTLVTIILHVHIATTLFLLEQPENMVGSEFGPK